MKVFFDTEFIGDSLTMLSIGAVREDKKVFYAVVDGADMSQLDDFGKDVVVPRLWGSAGWSAGDGMPKSLSVIANEFREFCGPSPEFWGYYADYDWFYLCQMYGGMMKIPKDWPWFCMDVVQEMKMRAVETKFPVDPKREHNALYDALWTRNQYLHVMKNGTALRS